ncbi:MAG: metal ABC transporter permease [Ilumatobacteraceae bacterium]|jgi:manganese/iron transport system permease protein/iron/zinc/copper transport system permease protein|nr:metal ABC transporter permease [Ilumatobacteraceae bacterium]
MNIALDLLAPYDFAFFQRGMVAATLAGALCGVLGVFVVLRGMSYIGHGLSHAVFGGAAASAVMSINFFVGAGIWGVISGVLIGRIARQKIIGADAAIGIVTTASFAGGIALLNRYGQARKSIEAVLFGSVLGVSWADIAAILAVSLAVGAIVLFAYRAFLFATFDPQVATVSGERVAAIEVILMVMLSVTILVTMRVIGTLLISALLVIPAATARMVTNSFSRMLMLSPMIGAACCLVGMNLSYHLDTSAGATIILVAAAVFTATYLLAGRRARLRVASLNHL